MTMIGSIQNSLAYKLAQQRAAEAAASVFQTPVAAPISASKIVTTATSTDLKSTGTMQPPLSPPTVTALLSASQQPSGSLAVSNFKQYKHVTEDEKNLPIAAKDFLEYSRKTTAEKIRDAILKEEGLTEDDLAKMSPSDRQAMEDKIAAKIKERMKIEMEKKAENPSSDGLL